MNHINNGYMQAMRAGQALPMTEKLTLGSVLNKIKRIIIKERNFDYFVFSYQLEGNTRYSIMHLKNTTIDFLSTTGRFETESVVLEIDKINNTVSYSRKLTTVQKIGVGLACAVIAPLCAAIFKGAFG